LLFLQKDKKAHHITLIIKMMTLNNQKKYNALIIKVVKFGCAATS